MKLNIVSNILSYREVDLMCYIICVISSIWSCLWLKFPSLIICCEISRLYGLCIKWLSLPSKSPWFLISTWSQLTSHRARHPLNRKMIPDLHFNLTIPLKDQSFSAQASSNISEEMLLVQFFFLVQCVLLMRHPNYYVKFFFLVSTRLNILSYNKFSSTRM